MFNTSHEGIRIVVHNLDMYPVSTKTLELGLYGINTLTRGNYSISCEETDYDGLALVLLDIVPTIAICSGTLTTSTTKPIAAIFSLDSSRDIVVAGQRGNWPLINHNPKTGGLDVTNLINNRSKQLTITWGEQILINRG